MRGEIKKPTKTVSFYELFYNVFSLDHVASNGGAVYELEGTWKEAVVA